jgi:thiamine kinase-like enzyme
MRSDHSSRFTHADLSLRNIIIKDDKIQGTVDWEFSGWYPEYWEYVKFFECRIEGEKLEIRHKLGESIYIQILE